LSKYDAVCIGWSSKQLLKTASKNGRIAML